MLQVSDWQAVAVRCTVFTLYNPLYNRLDELYANESNQAAQGCLQRHCVTVTRQLCGQ